MLRVVLKSLTWASADELKSVKMSEKGAINDVEPSLQVRPFSTVKSISADP